MEKTSPCVWSSLRYRRNRIFPFLAGAATAARPIPMSTTSAATTNAVVVIARLISILLMTAHGIGPPLAWSGQVASANLDEHRPERPVLLAVDQEFGEGPRLRIPPELSDPVGPLKVGQRQDVEQLGAGSGTEGVKALPESALQLIRPHG
jgi:hypothetical protein